MEKLTSIMEQMKSCLALYKFGIRAIAKAMVEKALNKNLQADDVRGVFLCAARKLAFMHTNSHRIHRG